MASCATRWSPAARWVRKASATRGSAASRSRKNCTRLATRMASGRARDAANGSRSTIIHSMRSTQRWHGNTFAAAAASAARQKKLWQDFGASGRYGNKRLILTAPDTDSVAIIQPWMAAMLLPFQCALASEQHHIVAVNQLRLFD